MSSLPETFQSAVQYQQAGQLPAAEELYRQILAKDPRHAQTLHQLGVMACQRGQYEQAVTLIFQALAIHPQFAEAWNNLGSAFSGWRQHANAINAYRQALAVRSNFFDAQHNLAIVLSRVGDRDAAAAAFLQALDLRPQSYEANVDLARSLKEHRNYEASIRACQAAINIAPDRAEAYGILKSIFDELGLLRNADPGSDLTSDIRMKYAEAWVALGRFYDVQTDRREAVRCFQLACQLAPGLMVAHFQLGTSLVQLGKPEDALQAFEAAAKSAPEDVAILNGMGIAWAELRCFEKSVAAFRRALELRPNSRQLLDNLCKAYQILGNVDETINVCQQVIALHPDLIGPHNHLGNAYKNQGNLSAAVACYRRAIELGSDSPDIHSNLLFSLCYCFGVSTAELAAAHQEFQQRYAAKLAAKQPIHRNSREPDRRLRIGYVSPDLNSHPVGRFLVPLLENHNRESCQVFCYASVTNADDITERCRRSCDCWRDVVGYSDERVAQLVEQDQIDILVDLSMHTGENRLLAFALKPAPVQVTYLAYGGTTGLKAVDYRLTDPYLDPPSRREDWYSEESIHLPESFWCYQADEQAPPVGPPPALNAGHVTFGSFNNFCKVNARVLATWGQILEALPNSRLKIHAIEGAHRRRVLEVMSEYGVNATRIDFCGRVSRANYFKQYGEIDIALDPFPFCGGTTTCDALWMGVPVVSLIGERAVGRGGQSILSNIGLPELAASDQADYVRIAVALANDWQRLISLRTTMRPRMEASPLMDAPRFARNIEAAFRTMWHRYCVGKT